jgi:aspartyl protease family protein
MLKVAGTAVAIAIGLAAAGPNLGASLIGMLARPTPAKAAARPPASAPARATLDADAAGHYRAEVAVDGRPLTMIVDTGATSVVLRHEDAAALGLISPGQRADVTILTANGKAMAQRIRLASVRLGSITLHDVDAIVTPPGSLPQNLLGMAFLGRMERIEARGGRLVLEQ